MVPMAPSRIRTWLPISSLKLVIL